MDQPVRKPNAFSILEMLITIGVMVILFVVFLRVIDAALGIWRQGEKTLKIAQERHTPIPYLYERLRTAVSITEVSLSNDDTGAIRYVDAKTSQNIHIYMTGDEIAADFPTGNTEILANGIEEFTITTYTDATGDAQIVSVNNQSTPISYDEITSIKLRVKYIGAPEPSVQIIQLIKTQFESADSIHFGWDHNAPDEYPFRPMSGYAGFTTQNVILTADSGNPVNEPDGGYLATGDYTVKIRNTGKYYASIASAMNNAVSGDEILVAARSGGYQNLDVTPGVKVYGGYNSGNWARNISENITVIYRTATASATVQMADNSLIDGFVIDSNGLGYGCAANTITGFVVSNCAFYDTSGPAIYAADSEGKILNNLVSGNGTLDTSLVIDSCTVSLNVLRNRFYSYTDSTDNVVIKDSANVNFRNNIVWGGDTAVNINLSTPVLTIQIVNNIITNANTYGIDSTGGADIFSNAVCTNNTGVRYNSGFFGEGYNLYSRNTADSSGFSLDPSDVTDNLTQLQWETANPYFVDFNDYILITGNVCVDSGISTNAYDDTYYDSYGPGKGILINDIGLYGGPFAGRAGVGQIRNIYNSDTAVQMNNALKAAWAGDYVLFNKGSYSFSGPLQARQYYSIMGELLNETIMTVSGTFIALAKGNTLQTIRIDSAGTGIDIQNINNVSVKDCLIRSCTTGLNIVNAQNIQAKHLTLDANTTGMVCNNSSVSILRNIITSSNIGVQMTGGASVDADYTFYFNNISNWSGTFSTNTNYTIEDPFYWDLGQNMYNLLPSSNAVNADGNRDLGAFEFYLATGDMTSPEVTSNIQRRYNTLVLKLFGDSDNIPEITGNYSEIEPVLYVGDTAVNLTPNILVTSNSERLVTYNLALDIISKRLKIELNIHSYKPNSTPYINDVFIYW
ncbi:hypothetical protein ACFL96_03685 [Thermoproteota archaeon]